MKKHQVRRLSIVASVSGLLSTAPAFAERQAPSVDAPAIPEPVTIKLARLDPQSAETGPRRSDQGSAARDRNIEEVVVSAQKREESLLNVPISVSVLSGENLDRSSVEGVTEALTQVPGAKITVGNQGGGTQISLRGVSAGGPLFNGSSTVAYYIDSVPFGFVKTAAVPDANVFDMQRVEVLRGPQGTLYGAGALNGVVRLLSNEADLSDFELKARTTISSTDGGEAGYRGDVAVNVPIVKDRFAARVVLGYNELGGWIDRPGIRDANSGDVTNARVRLNAAPTDRLSLGFIAWRSRSDFDAPPIGLSDRTNSLAATEPYSLDYDIYGLNIDYDFGPFTLSSRTSSIDFTNNGLLGLAPTVFLTTRLDSEVTSEELLLTSNGDGNWRWSFGLFYRDAEDRLFQDLPGLLPVPIYSGNYSESYAVFGEVTRVLADGAFEITGGLRYFSDDVTQIEFIDSTGPRGGTFEKVSPRVVLTWHPTKDSTVYASYSEGFRSGFTQSAPVLRADPTFPPLDADSLRNYEIGARGTFEIAGRSLRYDLSGYYIDWQDVQQTIGVEIAPDVFATGAVNGTSASGAGADVALMFDVTDSLTVGVTGSYNDLTFDADVFSSGRLFFRKGERLNYSSEHTLGGNVEYELILGAGYVARLSGSAAFSSAQDNRSQNSVTREVTINEGDDILITRASLAIDAPENWGLMLFVDNANDERGTPSANSDPRQSTRARPRTWGLQLDYRF
jgi:iron complex outermembrane receptor protein